MLEAASAKAAFFVTLTYRLVQFNANGLPTLDPEHPQRWLKRFRKLYPPESIRYFLCGEYGSKTLRPHYHVVLFFSEWSLSNEHKISQQILETWAHGSVHIGDVTPDSLAYVLGYAVKGLTKSYKFPDGRFPEFARFSQGIGRGALDELARVSPTIPLTYRTNGREYPVPKYIKKKMETDYGMVKAPTPLDVQIDTLSRLRSCTTDSYNRDTPQSLQALNAIHELQAIDIQQKNQSRLRTAIRHQQRILERKKNETL